MPTANYKQGNKNTKMIVQLFISDFPTMWESVARLIQPRGSPASAVAALIKRFIHKQKKKTSRTTNSSKNLMRPCLVSHSSTCLSVCDGLHGKDKCRLRQSGSCAIKLTFNSPYCAQPFDEECFSKE